MHHKSRQQRAMLTTNAWASEMPVAIPPVNAAATAPQPRALALLPLSLLVFVFGFGCTPSPPAAQVQRPGTAVNPSAGKIDPVTGWRRDLRRPPNPFRSHVSASWELRAQTSTFKVGEPILIDFVMHNRSNQTIETGLVASPLRDLGVEIRNASGNRMGWRDPDAPSPPGEFGQWPYLDLPVHEAGETHVSQFHFDLTRGYDLSKPGWYEFFSRPKVWIYLTEPERQGAVGILPCKPVWFKIVE